jgi:hypothetical protein
MLKTHKTFRQKTLYDILFAGLMVFLFSGCAANAEEGSIAALFSPTPALSPTPTTIWFPVTSTPELIALPTSTPDVTTSPDFGSLTFNDAGVVQEHWLSSQEMTGVVAAGESSVNLAVNSPRSSLLSFRKDTTLNDFYYESVMTMGLCKNTDQAGVLFRAVDSQNYYAFLINCQGSIALQRVLKGTPAIIRDWSLTNQAQAGLTKPIKIGIWAQSSTIRIYLNDQLQYEVVSTTYYSGGIGFLAQASGDTSVMVNFSEIKVYKAAD